jgi:hypothetical protein
MQNMAAFAALGAMTHPEKIIKKSFFGKIVQ